MSESNWAGLHVSLQRFWEGKPIGHIGSFTGVVLTVWHMKAGDVIVRKGDHERCAKAGEWIVCHPGTRHQTFSDSARLVSLHLHVECPAGAARWGGEPVVAFGSDAKLGRLLLKLRQSDSLKKISAQGRLNPESEPATLEAMLELKVRTMTFFSRLITLLRPCGMHYEISPIRDPRVRETRRRLAASDLRDGFSREELARQVGISASQLDRLWMSELGQTPKHYWNWRRLEIACALLQEDRLAKEVAYETGFDHLSQFSLWFRANMDEAPSNFQARHRGTA